MTFAALLGLLRRAVLLRAAAAVRAAPATPVRCRLGLSKRRVR